jgi:hypothetical protein
MELQELKNFLFASIISADNDEFTEDQKQEVMRRYDLTKGNPDWEFILQPVDETGRLKELFV